MDLAFRDGTRKVATFRRASAMIHIPPVLQRGDLAVFLTFVDLVANHSEAKQNQKTQQESLHVIQAQWIGFLRLLLLR